MKWSSFTFDEFLTACKKLTKSDFFLKYYSLKNPAVSLDKSILAYKLITGIFPDIEFLLENQKQYDLSF